MDFFEYGAHPLWWVQKVNKSFAAGYDYNPTDMKDSQAGRVENLQATFVEFTNFEELANTHKTIPTEDISSPVLQEAVEEELGEASFYDEETGDVDWEGDEASRKIHLVKYLGVKGQITGVAELTDEIVPAVTLETRRKTKSLIRKINQTLLYGDADINVYEYNGIEKEIRTRADNPAQNIINLNSWYKTDQGGQLSPKLVNMATTIIHEAKGYGPTKLLGSPSGFGSFVDFQIDNGRFMTSGQDRINTNWGSFEQYKAANGIGDTVEDIFLNNPSAFENRLVDRRTGALKKGNAKGPDAPTAVISTEGTTTGFSLSGGDYEYLIVPVNKYGRGMGFETGINFSGSFKRVKFVITPAGTGNAATGFEIYRRPASSDSLKDYYYFTKVKSTGTTTTAYDDGEFVPKSSTAIMLIPDKDQVISVAQYGKYMKLPYGRRSDKIEWLMRYYHTLRVKNPNRIVVIKNVVNPALAA